MHHGRRVTRHIGVLVLTAATVAGSSAPASGAQQPAQAYVVPPSIDATGARDVSSQLLDFIATVPDNATIEFAPRARYRIEATLDLNKRRGLVLDGRGATFFATTPGNLRRAHWRFRGGGPITLRNITVRGAAPNAGSAKGAHRGAVGRQHGFDFRGVEGVQLDHVTVTDVYGDFFYLGQNAGAPHAWTRHVRIRDSHFERNGRQGTTLFAAEDVVIERNYIGDVALSVFHIEPGSRGGARDIIITNNMIGSAEGFFLTASGAPEAPVESVSITQNRLVGKPFDIALIGHAGGRRSRFHVAENSSDQPSRRRAVTVVRVDDVTIEDNQAVMVEGRHDAAILVCDSTSVVARRNEFRGVKQVVAFGDKSQRRCDGAADPKTAAPDRGSRVRPEPLDTRRLVWLALASGVMMAMNGLAVLVIRRKRPPQA